MFFKPTYTNDWTFIAALFVEEEMTWTYTVPNPKKDTWKIIVKPMQGTSLSFYKVLELWFVEIVLLIRKKE